MYLQKIAGLSVFILLLSFIATAQKSGPEERFAATADYFRHSQIYVHLDKSVYTRNENIWLAAYLLRSPLPLDSHHTLFVFLSDRLTHRVVASEKFVMEGGMAAGNLFIPDSLRAGEYDLFAYTNTFTSEPYPQPFRQELSIRTAAQDLFTVQPEKSDASRIAGDTLYFMCRVVNKESLYAKNAIARYKILMDGREIKSDSAIINQYGELPVKFRLPEQPHALELFTEIIKDKTSFTTRVAIPLPVNTVLFSWYPEGGDLVNGIKSRVAFRVRFSSGSPAMINGSLLQNGRLLTRIQTNAAGLGIAEFSPVAGSVYTVQLDDKEMPVTINFPVVKQAGYSMQVTNGVTKDTLFVRINSSAVNNQVTLLLHNYQQELLIDTIDFVNRSVMVKIPLASVPAGLATITLFDSNGEPCAERTIFNGYQQVSFFEITADSAQYHTRSKVTLSIKARDDAGRPLQAAFSLANVFGKRIDTLSYQDIVPYHFLNGYIEQGLITRPPLYDLGNTAQLEMFLLTHCWTRYRLPARDTTAAAVVQQLSLSIKGRVIPEKKYTKLPVELAVMSKQGMEFVKTDSAGRFELPTHVTSLDADTKLQVVVNSKQKEEYTIRFDEENNRLDKQLATRYYAETVQVKAALPEEEKTLINNIKTLSTAIVKSRNSNEWDTAVYQSRTCNDYFCMYNILNCRNHPGGMRAINGQYYMINGRLSLYHCDEAMVKHSPLLYIIKGRYYTKEFYIADYAKFNPPEPEFYSTVYWNPQLMTDKEGNATISFYTNDLPGQFFCIAEGVTTNGFISGKNIIKVVK